MKKQTNPVYAHINIEKGIINITNDYELNNYYNYGDVTLENFKISKDDKSIIGDVLQFKFDWQNEIPDEELDKVSFKEVPCWFSKKTKTRRIGKHVLLKKRSKERFYRSNKWIITYAVFV